MKDYKFPVYIIQGAQYGSEGKGQIAALYAGQKSAVAAVRTGSINAGHSVCFKGQRYKMQQLPTAWANNDRDCYLVLGPGAYVHRETLARETAMVSEALGWDIRERLIIDRRCPVHSVKAELLGHHSGRHEAMGATGKGSSDAVCQRMMARSDLRLASDLTFSSHPFAHQTEVGDMDFSHCIADAVHFLRDSLPRGPVVLEGTQGAMLDFITGPYPYVTNRAVSTAAWLAYAGLPPTLDIRVVLVARTYPIRVAGNSGPMPGELEWPELYRRIRAKDAHAVAWNGFPNIAEMTLVSYEARLAELVSQGGGPSMPMSHWTPEQRAEHRKLLSSAPTSALLSMSQEQQTELLQFFERTTVTNKLRRVSEFDANTLLEARWLNGCTEMWLTFLNYEYPELWGSTEVCCVEGVAGGWLQDIEQRLERPIVGVTTERYPENHLWLRK